jgi:hypothetical protein
MRLPGRAVLPVPLERGTVDRLACHEGAQGQAAPPTNSAMDQGCRAVLGSGARVGWRRRLAAGRRACHLPSGQIPPSWAWWERGRLTPRALPAPRPRQPRLVSAAAAPWGGRVGRVRGTAWPRRGRGRSARFAGRPRRAGRGAWRRQGGSRRWPTGQLVQACLGGQPAEPAPLLVGDVGGRLGGWARPLGGWRA